MPGEEYLLAQDYLMQDNHRVASFIPILSVFLLILPMNKFTLIRAGLVVSKLFLIKFIYFLF